jgi:hypothetical protein
MDDFKIVFRVIADKGSKPVTGKPLFSGDCDEKHRINFYSALDFSTGIVRPWGRAYAGACKNRTGDLY